MIITKFAAFCASLNEGVVVPLQYEEDYSRWLDDVAGGGDEDLLETYPLNDMYRMAHESGQDWRDLYAAVPHVPSENTAQVLLENAFFFKHSSYGVEAFLDGRNVGGASLKDVVPYLEMLINERQWEDVILPETLEEARSFGPAKAVVMLENVSDWNGGKKVSGIAEALLREARKSATVVLFQADVADDAMPYVFKKLGATASPSGDFLVLVKQNITLAQDA